MPQLWYFRLSAVEDEKFICILCLNDTKTQSYSKFWIRLQSLQLHSRFFSGPIVEHFSELYSDSSLTPKSAVSIEFGIISNFDSGISVEVESHFNSASEVDFQTDFSLISYGGGVHCEGVKKLFSIFMIQLDINFKGLEASLGTSKVILDNDFIL